MNRKPKVTGQIHFYITWPFYAALAPAVCTVLGYMRGPKTGTAFLVFTLVYLLVAWNRYRRNQEMAYAELVEFAEDYASAQNKLFRELNIPYALMVSSGRIIWMNEAFREVSGDNSQFTLTIFDMFPKITKDKLPTYYDAVREFTCQYGDRDYRIEICCVDEHGTPTPKSEIKAPREEFYAAYLFDETLLNTYIRKTEEERLVTGLIYIDNYDEVMDDVPENGQSLFAALIDRSVIEYVMNVDGIAKKMGDDKYFIIFKQKYYEQLAKEHFGILEDVKKIQVGNDIGATLSIGLAMHCDTLQQSYEFSRSAIDMALARGGDQVVVKDKDKIRYFGGKTQHTEKGTRVKARVKAEALREFIIGSEKVIIMGHQIADVDVLGSAMGIYRIAVSLGKKVHIVLDDVTASVKPFVRRITSDESYPKDLFVRSREILDKVNDNTVLVIVDTNRPNYTQCPDLIYEVRQVAVLDHHRKGEETVNNAYISYIEPYASSASEMVAEIVQYIDDNIKLKSAEADCLFAGIMLDTNNFMTKAGVRTFEAAAYLKASGADVVRVRKLFREDVESYQAKAETIHAANIYRKSFAIAVFPETQKVESPTIVGAQAANEMLNICGIKASFVLTKYKESIYISARSIDEVNVQLVMERLGGGGHMSTAGAQLRGVSMDKAIKLLEDTLDEMIEGGEI